MQKKIHPALSRFCFSLSFILGIILLIPSESAFGQCTLPLFTGVPVVEEICVEGDSLGTQIVHQPNYTYKWTSDVGIESDSTQRTIFVNKAGTYSLRVEDSIPSCFTETAVLVFVNKIILNPLDTTICASEAPARLVARDVANPTGYTYEWRNLKDTSVVVQIDTLGVLETDSSGIFLVTVNNPKTGCIATDTVEAIINPNPSFEINGYDGPHCERGDTLVIENTNINNFTIKWEFLQTDTAGAFLGATDELQAIVLRTGTYAVTLTDTLVTPNCSTTDTIAVVVNGNPIVALGADTSICQDTEISVDAFHFTHDVNVTYQWQDLINQEQLSDSSRLVLNFDQLSNPSFDFVPYEVTVTNSLSQCQSKDTIRVQFVAKPEAEIIAPKQGLCLGDSLVLQGTGGESYTWNTGDTTEFITIKPDTIGFHTYILESSFPNACASVFDTITISVTNIPFIDVGTDSVSICETDSVFLDAFEFSHPFSTLYEWTNVGDGAIISTGSRVTLSFDTFANPDYSPFQIVVKVTDSLAGCSAVDTVIVEFGRNPTATIEQDFPEEICLGESLTFTASGGDQIVWSTGDSTASITVTPTQAKIERYIVYKSNLNACPTATDTVFVTVNPLPEIQAHTEDSVTICAGDSVTLIPSGGEAGAYTWLHDPTVNDTITVAPSSTTTYYIVGIDSNGCQNNDSVRVEVRATIDLGADIQACEGDIVTIGQESPVPATYFWTPGGDTSPFISVDASNTYQVRVTTDDCTYTREIDVVFKEYPELISSIDTALCFELGAEEFYAEEATHRIGTTINNLDTGASYNFVWTDTTGVIIGQEDSLTIADSGVYIVRAFDSKLTTLCVSTDTIRIGKRCEPRIFVPSGFTPNGDELNDTFHIYGKHIEFFTMDIYDRWGVLIYTLSTDNFDGLEPDSWWDGTINGKPALDGVYNWTIQYANSYNETLQQIQLTGRIAIIH
jgi:gliding motility-associated-like protein